MSKELSELVDDSAAKWNTPQINALKPIFWKPEYSAFVILCASRFLFMTEKPTTLNITWLKQHIARDAAKKDDLKIEWAAARERVVFLTNPPDPEELRSLHNYLRYFDVSLILAILETKYEPGALDALLRRRWVVGEPHAFYKNRKDLRCHRCDKSHLQDYLSIYHDRETSGPHCGGCGALGSDGLIWCAGRMSKDWMRQHLHLRKATGDSDLLMATWDDARQKLENEHVHLLRGEDVTGPNTTSEKLVKDCEEKMKKLGMFAWRTDDQVKELEDWHKEVNNLI